MFRNRQAPGPGKPLLAAAMPALTGLVLALSWGTQAVAQEESPFVKAGRIEYEQNCAACHGTEGKGDGPVSDVLTQAPADLTRITAEFSGTFPRNFLIEVIDGRRMINPHGDRQMPVWRSRFIASALQQRSEGNGDIDLQEIVLTRITALVDYIESIQAD